MNNHPRALPTWSRRIIDLYQSGATSQFILHGNVHDLLPLPDGRTGLVRDFFLEALMPGFDVVLSYDVGNGVRIERGGEILSDWPGFKEVGPLPRAPRPAIEFLTRYFRYSANLATMGRETPQIGCILFDAHLVAPGIEGFFHPDINALAVLIRDWSSSHQLARTRLATCLVTENLHDLHPMLSLNPRAEAVKIPLPEPSDLTPAIEAARESFPLAVKHYAEQPGDLAEGLAGSSLQAVQSMLRFHHYRDKPILPADLARIRKETVERECEGLIEFIPPKRSFDDLFGMEPIKDWLRQDVQLWEQKDFGALPMGYLLCGPVGNGKTYLAECLAGEAGVPVVKLRNFRDRWVGATESNLERIFRLLQALGRCYVFIDEADQTLGKRESGGNDGGLSGRVYAMIAKEMSNPDNRGKLIWILASSRPDLIEVDLKRPGRVDVKIPIFPTTTAEESFGLLDALCARREIPLPSEALAELESLLPARLTPGAAEALAIRIYRRARTRQLSPLEAAKSCLIDYQPPVPEDIITHQIHLAVREASDIAFVPEIFRERT